MPVRLLFAAILSAAPLASLPADEPKPLGDEIPKLIEKLAARATRSGKARPADCRFSKIFRPS